MLHDVAVKARRTRGMVTGEDIIRGEMVRERSLRGTKFIRSSFLERSRNSTGSVEDGNDVPKEKKTDCVHALLKKNPLSKWPFM